MDDSVNNNNDYGITFESVQDRAQVCWNCWPEFRHAKPQMSLKYAKRVVPYNTGNAIVLPFIPISDRSVRPIGSSGQHFEYICQRYLSAYKWKTWTHCWIQFHTFPLFLNSDWINLEEFIAKSTSFLAQKRDQTPKPRALELWKTDQRFQWIMICLNVCLSVCMYGENYWYRQFGKGNKYWFSRSPRSLRIPSSLLLSWVSPPQPFQHTEPMINWSQRFIHSLCVCHLFIRCSHTQTVLWLIFQSIARKNI